MNKIAAVFAAVLVGGCATSPPPITLPSAEAQCASVPFVQYGRCIEAKFDATYPAWRMNLEADLAQTYLSWLNAAASRIENGSMDEPTARMGAAEIRTRLYEIVAQRRSAEASARQERQQDMSQLLIGLALINASQPQPSSTLPITCTTVVFNKATGQTQTHCW